MYKFGLDFCFYWEIMYFISLKKLKHIIVFNTVFGLLFLKKLGQTSINFGTDPTF